MAHIEDLVRDSLRQRAQDVEPTPSLWREVDRRIDRRRRRMVTSWSLAAVAAALAAFVVVPGLLGDAQPDDLAIEPMGPTGPMVSSMAVVADDGGLSLVDLTGQAGPTSLVEGDGRGDITQVEVRPGSSAADYDVAAVRIGDDGVAEILLASSVDGRSTAVEGRIEEHALAPGFVPTIGWAPDGRALLYTVPSDADGAVLVVEEVAPTGDTFVDASRGIELAVIENGATVLDWVGATKTPGDVSEILLRRSDGQIVTLALTVDVAGSLPTGDDIVTAEAPGLLTGTLDVAGAHEPTDPAGDALYVLARGDDGTPQLGWSPGRNGEPVVPIEDAGLTAAIGTDVAASRLWLSAKKDAALVGDGERMWLVAHDGSGAFRPAVEVATGVETAALLDANRPAGVEDPPSEESTDPDQPTETGQPTDSADVPLPEPLLVAADKELRLLHPDGTSEVHELTLEGLATVAGVAVRPGSTSEDLTAAILVLHEGIWDMWDVRIVDGQLTRDPLPGPYAPARNSPAGEGITVRGPVWSPDGTSLAWLEFGTGTPTLRTIGWVDGPGTLDSATDNAEFTLDDLEPGVVLDPVDWVDVPEADRTTIRGTWSEPADAWWALPLERQGDGAWAQTAGSPTSVRIAAPRASSGPVASVGGLAPEVGIPDTAGQAGVGWMVRLSSDGPTVIRDPYGDARATPLPDRLLAAEDLLRIWALPLGDGVVVGCVEAAVAYHVTADGDVVRIEGEVMVADAIR